MTTVTAHKPKPKGVLIAALVFLLLGIAGCGFGAAKTVPYVSDLVDFANDLDQLGRIVSMGEEVSFTSSGSHGIALLSAEAVCTGEGPQGPVSFDAYEAFGAGPTVELGGVQLDGYILFDIETNTEYTIRCGDSSTIGSYTATTAPPFLVEGAPGFLAGIGAAFAGAFFVFMALILMIVGLVQRSRWKKQGQTFAAPTGYGTPAAQVPPAPGGGGGSPWATPPAPGQGSPGGWNAPPLDAPPQGPPPMPPPQGPPPQGPPQQGPPQQGPPPMPPAPPSQALPAQSPPPQAPPPPPPANGGEEPPAPPPLR